MMSTAMLAYEGAAQRLAMDPRSDFVGPRDPDVVLAAETRMGFRFPASYRRFLLEFGCGNVGSNEIFGVIGRDVEMGPIPNAVWLNLKRRAAGWNPSLFVIHESGEGASYALDLSDLDAEGEAAVWLVDIAGTPTEKVAANFGEFLRMLLI